MRAWLYIGVAVAVAGLLGCGDGEVSFAEVGRLAPDKTVESYSQPIKDISPRDFKGKVVVLDFWATWCGPCKQFMPVLQAFEKAYGPKGLVVMSITDEPRSTVDKFEKGHETGLPTYLDNFLLLHTAYHIEAIPHIAVIDRDGKLAYDGAADPAAVEKAIVKALG